MAEIKLKCIHCSSTKIVKFGKQANGTRLSNDYYPKRDIMEVKKHFHQFHYIKKGFH